eukprot:2706707-Prymnesium_polylepis.1
MLRRVTSLAAFRDDVQTHQAHSGPLVAHRVSTLDMVLTALPHTLTGEACREAGSADISIFEPTCSSSSELRTAVLA